MLRFNFCLSVTCRNDSKYPCVPAKFHTDECSQSKQRRG